FESEIGRGQRADRTNVDRVKRIIIFQALAWMRGQHGVTSAIDKPEHVILRDLVAKPNAARTKDATLVVECDARSEFHIFRFLDFVLEKSRIGRTVLHAEFL